MLSLSLSLSLVVRMCMRARRRVSRCTSTPAHAKGPLIFRFSQAVASPIRLQCSRVGPATMDARTAKRVAQVDHIKQKRYYRQTPDEPDPLLGVSTRMWKYTVRMWIRALKASWEDDGGRPHRRDDVPPAVMGGC